MGRSQHEISTISTLIKPSVLCGWWQGHHGRDHSHQEGVGGGGDKKTKFPHRIKVIGQNNFVLISTDLLSKGTSGSKVCQ